MNLSMTTNDIDGIAFSISVELGIVAFKALSAEAREMLYRSRMDFAAVGIVTSIEDNVKRDWRSNWSMY